MRRRILIKEGKKKERKKVETGRETSKTTTLGSLIIP